jgi:hypothetical protein
MSGVAPQDTNSEPDTNWIQALSQQRNRRARREVRPPGSLSLGAQSDTPATQEERGWVKASPAPDVDAVSVRPRNGTSVLPYSARRTEPALQRIDARCLTDAGHAPGGHEKVELDPQRGPSSARP